MTTVGRFLYDVLQDAERYTPDMISLAMGIFDPVSSQLTRPATWARGARVEKRTWSGIPYRRVRARWSELELEFQRHRPRPLLTELLQDYDLIQVVAGTPPWARVAAHASVPIALQVATLTGVERNGQYAEESAPAPSLVGRHDANHVSHDFERLVMWLPRPVLYQRNHILL